MPYKDKSQQRAARLRWVIKKHNERKQAGKCVEGCDRPATDYRCDECKDRHAALQQKYRKPDEVRLTPLAVSTQTLVERLLDIRAAGRHLNQTESVVRHWVEQKRIPYFKVAGRILFDPARLDTWRLTSGKGLCKSK